MTKLILISLSLALSMLSACGNLSDALSGTSKISLKEMTSGDSGSSSGDGGSGGTCQAQGTPQPPPAPKLDACTNDEAKSCSDVTVPDSTARPEAWKPLVDCLKKNESSLSDACKTEVDAIKPPPPPPGFPPPGDQGDGPGAGASGNSPGFRPHGAQGNSQGCGGAVSGYGFLGPCNADASTYCASSLPTRDSFRAMSLSEKLKALESVVSCLTENESSVSSACQEALTSNSGGNTSSN